MNCMNDNAANSLCVIRTSLEALELYVTKLMPQQGREECNRLLSSANGQLNYLCRMLNNVTDMLDGCTGRMQANLQPMPLSPLLYNLCLEANCELEKRGFSSRVHVEPPMEEVFLVRGDPVMAESLLMNLVPGLLRLGNGNTDLSVQLSRIKGRLHIQFWQAGVEMPENVMTAMGDNTEEGCAGLSEKNGFGFWLAAIYAATMGWKLAVRNEPHGCVVELEMEEEQLDHQVLLRSGNSESLLLAKAMKRLRCEISALFD